MGNQIQNYLVIPNAEKINQNVRTLFIEQTMKGLVDERGYSQLEPSPIDSNGNYSNSLFINQPIILKGYQPIPDLGRGDEINPQFQRLHYQKACGSNSSIVVHIDIVDQNSNLEGLDGLVIDNGLLVKIV